MDCRISVYQEDLDIENSSLPAKSDRSLFIIYSYALINRESLFMFSFYIFIVQLLEIIEGAIFSFILDIRSGCDCAV